MNPKQFLQIGGIILILVGVLGFFLIGPTAEQSIFGENWWFDNPENWAHLVLGIVAVALAYAVKNAMLQKWVTIIVGVVALIAGISGFVTPNFLGANMENPLDNILHLVIGVWALWAGFKKGGMAPMGMSGGMGGNMGGGMGGGIMK